MKLLIVSSAPFIFEEECIYAYAPYVEELSIWEKYSSEIGVCSPVWDQKKGLLVTELPFKYKKHFRLIEFDLKSVRNFCSAFFISFYNLKKIFEAMIWADHIHLRCPGNMGLLACLLQIFFPSKTKTAKYAGNWDPKSKQPWTYLLQKWILSNTFLTRNMKVLVYGQWDKQSSNIRSFFTASYSESEEKTDVKTISANKEIRILFVGTLVEGKNPLYAIQLLEQLKRKNLNVHLNIFGDGPLRIFLQDYIKKNSLSESVFLHGNQNKEVLKKAYQESHFVILASKSEGWPKAIAEGMFWGCVPLATAVSCVPYMLDYGNRGILLQKDLEKDTDAIFELINQAPIFEKRSNTAMNWSRKYTLEYFENEIKKLF